MQSRETAAAPAQRPDHVVKDSLSAHRKATQSAPGSKLSPGAKALDDITALAALGWSVAELYVAQLKLAGKTAKAEWQLTGRSLLIGAALLVCFGAGVILLWAGTLTLLGMLLWQVSQSITVTAATLIILQLALLWWCWHSLAYVLTQVGFTQSWRQLRRIFVRSARAKSNKDTHHPTQE
ncbi:hypothetical protein [Rheinheimera fenheensis]|uniref:hypothetical protein n=1 Tax=Rheinheimera fenheensis TaxID=3152295 RepID=UPI00325EDC66